MSAAPVAAVTVPLRPADRLLQAEEIVRVIRRRLISPLLTPALPADQAVSGIDAAIGELVAARADLAAEAGRASA